MVRPQLTAPSGRAPGPEGWPAWLRGGARSRTAVSFGAVALVVFGGLALAAGHAVRRESERVGAEILDQVAEAMALRLDDDMAHRVGEIGRLVAIEQVLGVEMTPARWRPVLAELQRSLDDYSWIGVTDTAGGVIAATQGLLEGRNVAQRTWFQRGSAGPAVVDVHDAPLLNKLLPPQPGGEPYRFVDVAAPLVRDGRTVGVVGAHLNWRWAEERRRQLLSESEGTPGLELRIVGPKGEVLLGPPHAAGDAVLVARKPSRPQGAYPGMGWAVEVTQPRSMAFAAASRLQALLLALAVGGTALFAAAGWWLAGALTARLRRAAQRAREQFGAAPGADDEVTQISASLAALAGGLEQRESDLRELNHRFEQQLHSRTTELAEQNERLRGFTRSVSHDLRGPLGQMALLLELMLEREGPSLPADAQRKVEVVASECARLSRLTGEMLALAMVEQKPLATQPVEHAQVVRTVLDELRERMPGQAPAVQVGPLPVLEGDPVLLRQVWLNLLANAFKYTGKAQRPRVDVSARREKAEWHFTVADNGAGFDPSQAERLFSAFVRLHRDEEFEGSGIGLTIVQRVLQRHGGRAWAEGEPGVGASFHFALPA